MDDPSIYLPSNLSGETQKELFALIKEFRISWECNHFYTIKYRDEKILYQGDGIKNLLFANPLTDKKVKRLSIIVSNTCDNFEGNKRVSSINVLYAPIFRLEDYKRVVSNRLGASGPEVDQHIESVKRQEVSHIFYLPGIDGVMEESLVSLDQIVNLPLSAFNIESIRDDRAFTLSQFGFYMFLLKLSVHFTRMREGIDRE